MQRDLFTKSRSLGGGSDLTLLAPIRPGLVESLESVSHKTRIKRVLEALHGSRTQSHEHHLARLLSDSIERVGAIHSVRVAVLEPEDKVLLAVSFDGPWEAYVRVLWDKVGTLLDLIFFGSVDYVLAHGGRFEDWRAWAYRVQVETGFFYGPPDASARDLLYHHRVERMERAGAGGALNQVRAVLPSAERAMEVFVRGGSRPRPDDEPVFGLPPNGLYKLTLESAKNGVQALAALYRLTDFHRPSTADGEVLRRASVDLLREFVQLWQGGQIVDEMARLKRSRFERQIVWLFPDGKVEPLRRPRPPRPLPVPLPASVLSRAQVGIVRPHGHVTHGAVLLLGFDDAQAAATFLAWVRSRITPGDSTRPPLPAHPHCSLSFTPAGLRACGMDEDTLELFPEDFRQGMAARAGLLGDVHNNHPQRWRLPRRGLSPGSGPLPAHDEVPLDAVHAVLQLRCLAHAGTHPDVPLDNAAHPLSSFVQQLLASAFGTRLLSAQALVRRFRPGGGEQVQEHFGYADGAGQPELEPGGVGGEANRVHLGEVLLGHASAADFAPDPTDPTLAEPARRRLAWQTDGSFLAMRKYRQFAHRLESAVRHTAQQMVDAGWGGAADDHLETVYARLMGRDRAGVALIPNRLGNDFDYRSDPQGTTCPLQAHIRLAHPRHPPGELARPPRLMRRSMSYGPAHAPGVDDDAEERGLVFMAYSSSLSEQFEVVQRWLAGGNSTGKSTSHGCPLLAVPENGLPRHFRLELPHPDTGKPTVFTVTLEAEHVLFAEPGVVARLEWGLYLFAPSVLAVGRLAGLAACAAARAPRAEPPWSVARGRELLTALQRTQSAQDAAAALRAWKLAIEDPQAIDRQDSAALWGAIREDHGGVLRTPYGVLVASRELLHRVLLDVDRQYSIGGQRQRMIHSFGDIYLGMDPGTQYETESHEVNAAIGLLAATPTNRDGSFDLARKAANAKFDAIVSEARDMADDISDSSYDVSLDAREIIDDVLVALCDAWFGLKGTPFLQAGSTDWAWADTQPPLYPGHFTALSRHMFQPHPGALPAELSFRYGQGLQRAMTSFVVAHRRKGTLPTQADGSPALIAQAIFNHPTLGHDLSWVARTMVGVMMGFIAPLIGSLVNVLREWHRDGSFWALRNALAGRSTRADAERVLLAPIMSALRMRPMPQLVWRTVVSAHRLGGPGQHAVEVVPGDIVVLALVSGTQQALADGHDDDRLMFGGARVPGTAHPTHACPGYGSAIDSLLGTLSALLTREEVMHPGGSPLSWRVTGPVADEATLEFATAAFALAAPELKRPSLPPRPRGRKGTVIAIGDSWVDKPFGLGSDLREELASFDWHVDNELCGWLAWGKAKTLEDRLDDLGDLLRGSLANVPPGKPLKAVLVSAGGNDSTKSAFQALLDANDQDPATPALNGSRLATHVKDLGRCYGVVIDRIKKELVCAGVDVPVIVHGYDHSQLPPRPGLKSWFDDPFKELGYGLPPDFHPDRLQALKDLIDAFNEELTDLAGSAKYKAFVRHVDLRGSIVEYWQEPVDAWRDHLHPNADAFLVMALRIDEQLRAPYP